MCIVWPPSPNPHPLPLATTNLFSIFMLLLLLPLGHFSRVRLLANPMDCSPPGSSIHGTLQARILEWAAIAFSLRTCVQLFCLSHFYSTFVFKVLCGDFINRKHPNWKRSKNVFCSRQHDHPSRLVEGSYKEVTRRKGHH